MSDKRDVIDAEFEVVTEPPPSIPLLLSGLIGSLVVLAVAFYFGMNAERGEQTLWLGAAGAGFAGAVRAAWMLFPALSACRRAQKGRRAAQAAEKLSDLR